MLTAILALALVAAVGALAAVCARRRARARDLARLTELVRDHDRAPSARARLELADDAALAALASALDRHLDEDYAREQDLVARDEQFREELAALSHDVRTPLAGAQGYLQLARRATAPEDVARYLGRAEERLAAMRVLVDDLFTYARAADPSFSPDLEEVDAAEVVAQVMAAHYEDFLARGWEPEVELPEAALVLSHAESLARIVENLISNALAHGSGAPHVRLAPTSAGLTLTVANPLSPADARRLDASQLTKRFYQADSARGGRGSGLGLSVVASLAKATGATFEAGTRDGLFVATLVLEQKTHR